MSVICKKRCSHNVFEKIRMSQRVSVFYHSMVAREELESVGVRELPVSYMDTSIAMVDEFHMVGLQGIV